MSMLENIRRIGIFMIAAQTVMHFSAGKQYEKYMKIIAGVIILLQFISPFVSSSENIAAKWKKEVEQMSEQMERQVAQQIEQQNSMSGMVYSGSVVETTALQQIETEVKNRFNERIAGDKYQIADVAIELDETGEKSGAGLVFRRVRIVLRRMAEQKGQLDGYAGKAIQIAPITVGEGDKRGTAQNETMQKAAEQVDEHNQVQDEAAREYCRIFAQMLGIAEDRVEVTCDGEW